MRKAGWKLRSRDKSTRRSHEDVLAARTGSAERPVGSRLTQPQGVGAPAVTGREVPTTQALEQRSSDTEE